MVDDARVARLLERWFAAVEDGAPLTPEEVCADDADLLPRFRRLVAQEDGARLFLGSFAGPGATPDVAVERLGDFEIGPRIGAGGMAIVHRARQVSLGRDVALKILDPAIARDPASRARFRREAEIMASLEHVHICPVYSVGEEGEWSYLAMKLLSGPGLDALDAPLPPRRTAEVGVAVADALAEAHEAGVIHRDVKPANVILDGDEPYLVDFGLARAASSRTLTRAGAVPGTLPYLAPEILSGEGGVLDARADVYGLGATLYEAISGHAPFTNEEPSRLVRDILERDAPPFGLSGEHRDLETIVLRALDKEPGRRFQTAAAMGDELRRVLAGVPIESRRIGPGARLVRLARRHRRATTAFLVAGVLLLVVAGFVLARAIDEARATRRDAARIEAALRSLEIETGAVLLVQFAGRHGEDDARTLTLTRFKEGAVALTDLLDLLQGQSFVQSAPRVRHALERVERMGASSIDPRLTALGRAAALLFLDEPERAREALGSPALDPADRGVLALRAVADGEDVVRALAARDVENDPYGHVFAALALRLADRATDVVRAELDAALDLDDWHLRARYGYGALLDEEGDVEATRQCFVGLAPDDGMARATVLRTLASQEMYRGKFEKAAALLEKARAAPGASTDGLQVLAELELARYRGDGAEVERLLDEALAAWPDDPKVLMHAGEAAANTGRFDEARALLTSALAAARVPSQRRSIELARLELRYATELPSANDLTGAPLAGPGVKTARALLADLRRLEGAAVRPLTRDRARVLLSRILRLLGDVSGSWPPLLAAFDDGTRNPSAHLRYALLVAEHLQKPPDEQLPGDVAVIGEDPTPDIRLARQRARFVTERRSRVLPTDAEVEAAWVAEVMLARADGDAEGVLRACDEALARMERRGAVDAPLFGALSSLRDGVAAWLETENGGG